MPELPEVRRYADFLRSSFASKAVAQVTVLGGRYLESPIPGLAEFQKELPLKVSLVKTKGKFLYWAFDNEWSLWNSLGMSGAWRNTTDKHAVIKIEADVSVFFIDPRHFGTLKFVKGQAKLESKLKTLGPDLMDEPLEKTDFAARLRKKGKV